MEFSAITICFLSFVSLIAGFVDSIAGGGGLLTIPSLLFAGVPPQFALGTNKLSSCVGTLTAVWNFSRKKLVWWPLAVFGVGFTLLGSFLGARAILAVDEIVVGRIIVFLLPFAALSLFAKRKNGPKGLRPKTLSTIALKAGLVCLALGFYDGFFGPGTGAFLILAFFALLHLNLVQATANAKVFNFASNASSLAVFLLHQKVLFSIALPMALGNIAGNFLGSHLAIKKGDAFVKHALLGVFCLLFGSLTYKFLLAPQA